MINDVSMSVRSLFIVMVAACFASVACGDESKDRNDFARDIRPILDAHCVACHGEKKQENGLRLDSGAAVLRGGDSGPSVIARKADESLLLQAVLGTSDTVSKMPLKKPPLSEAEVATLRRW